MKPTFTVTDDVLLKLTKDQYRLFDRIVQIMESNNPQYREILVRTVYALTESPYPAVIGPLWAGLEDARRNQYAIESEIRNCINCF